MLLLHDELQGDFDPWSCAARSVVRLMHYTLISLVTEFWRVDLWAENTSGRCLIRPCLVSSTERLELEACVGSQREGHGVARRANAILLLDDRKSCQWIAEFPYLADDTLRGWHRSWRESGWEALAVDGWKVASLILPLLRMRLYAPGWKDVSAARRLRSGLTSPLDLAWTTHIPVASGFWPGWVSSIASPGLCRSWHRPNSRPASSRFTSP